ncbi:MAG: response regulator [Candidatus Xenobia bacterium]
MIADDQSVFRQMMLDTLAEEDDVQVVGEATNGEEAIEQALKLGPDIVLMDINMPKKNGIEATSTITRARPGTRVVILTAYDDEQYVCEIVRAGATGYVLKESHASEVIRAIRTAYSGESLIQPRVMTKILREFSRLLEDRPRAPEPDGKAAAQLEQLTEREREVLALIGMGLNNKEIGLKLFISEPTVKTHVANLMHKLAFRDRIEAVLFAVRSGLLQ